MQAEAELNYADLKAFLSFFAERYLKAEGLPPGCMPISSLEALEKKSMSLALNGLRQAINDCVTMSFHLDHREVKKLDSQLHSHVTSRFRRRVDDTRKTTQKL